MNVASRGNLVAKAAPEDASNRVKQIGGVAQCCKRKKPREMRHKGKWSSTHSRKEAKAASQEEMVDKSALVKEAAAMITREVIAREPYIGSVQNSWAFNEDGGRRSTLERTCRSRATRLAGKGKSCTK